MTAIEKIVGASMTSPACVAYVTLADAASVTSFCSGPTTDACPSTIGVAPGTPTVATVSGTGTHDIVLQSLSAS